MTGSTRKKTGGGLAVSALVLGIVGSVLGLIPLLALIALVLGVVGLVLGLLGWRGGARKGVAIAGTLLSVLAITLSIIGFVVVDNAFSDLEDDLDQIEQEFNEDTQ